jgi:hypothetical protein
VEAGDDFNVLVNYWWRQSPAWMDPPANVLDYALLAIRDLPESQRAAWKELFDYYVFDNGPESHAHLPQARKGPLAPLDDAQARRLRAQLLNRLKR